MSDRLEKFIKQLKKCDIDHSLVIFEAYGFTTKTAYYASIGTIHHAYVTYWVQYFRVEAMAQGIPTWEMNYSIASCNVRDFAELFKSQFITYLNYQNNEEFLYDFKRFLLMTRSKNIYNLIQSQVTDIIIICRELGCDDIAREIIMIYFFF